MAAEALQRITVEEYFAILEASPTKLDFIDGRIIDPWAMEEGSPEAMAGGRIRHGAIPVNFARALEPALDRRNCLAVTSDVKVRFDEESNDYCFPDLSVVCGDVDDESDVIEAPTLVVEVLSPSTQGYDRGPKFERYLLIPSLEEIVFVFQEKPRVERYQRHGTVWVYEVVDGMDAQIEVLGTPVRLSDVYRRVRFSPNSPPHPCPSPRDEPHGERGSVYSSRPCAWAGGAVASIAVNGSRMRYVWSSPLFTIHESPASSVTTLSPT